MAVEEMKLINIIGPISDFDRVVMRYVIDNNIHLENMFNVFSNTRGFFPYTEANPYGHMMKMVNDTVGMVGIEAKSIPKGDYTMSADDIFSYTTQVKKMIEGIIEKRDEVISELESNQQIISQVEHISNIDIPLKDIFDFKHIKIRFGIMPHESYKKLNEFLSEYYAAFFFKFGEDKDGVYGMYCAPVSIREKIDTLFSSLYFERMRISDKAEGIPKEVIENLTEENFNLKAKLAELDNDIEIIVTKEREKLMRAYRSAYYLHEAYDVRKYAAHTLESFYIAGWIPQSEADNIVGQFDAEPNITILFEEPDIAKHLKPPTKLKNNLFVKPFEKFVEMYGLPSYNEFDPTMLFAITYSLLFGIMYGDVGHGAVLALTGILLKRKGSFLGPILKICGIVAAFFGAFYGSVFGFELEYRFMYKPMAAENMMTTLMVTVALGTIIIGIAMFYNIANGIRQKNIGKVLFDSNGLAGFVFYWSVIIGALSVVMGNSIMTKPYILIFVLFPLLLVFLKHPLAKLIQRKPDWMPEDKGQFILENFFEMFELILSYITNTISFIRVGAFALIHAGMMMVVYSLANVGQHSLDNLSTSKVLILILGNVVVIGLEGLLVAIQVLRLEFYEMFSRYFAGEGKPFSPRIVNQK